MSCFAKVTLYERCPYKSSDTLLHYYILNFKMRLKSNRVGCALIYSFLLSMQNSPCQRLSASYILLNIYETELVFQHMPTSQSMIDPPKKKPSKHDWFISTTNEVEMAMLSLIEKVFEPWNYIGQSCFLY